MKESVQAILDNQQLLLEAIRVVLEANESSITEFQLIQQLNDQGWQFTTKATDSHALFISHFLIFHSLYQLQEDFWHEEKRYLEIHTLTIKLHQPVNELEHSRDMAYESADAKLKAYYLNLDHLKQSSEKSVNHLLNQFWERFFAEDDSIEALQVFELSHPVTSTVIKQRYRQLAMQYHPDRGGDAAQFQKINWAFGILQRVYSKSE